MGAALSHVAHIGLAGKQNNRASLFLVCVLH